MKMTVFLDTNIVLDLLGERIPYYEPAAKVATLADLEELKIVVSALSFTTVSYFLTKYENSDIAKDKLRKFKVLTLIASVDEQTIDKALNSTFRDFEDALQYFSAQKSRSDILLTRNGKDFKNSSIPVMTPYEFLKSVNLT